MLKIASICLLILMIIISSAACSTEPIEYTDNIEPSSEPVIVVTPTPTFKLESTLAPEPEPELSRGFFESIPLGVQEKMTGVSMPEGASVTFDDLSYLTVYYYNFDYERTEGHVVVAKELADDVLDIFSELYDLKYPIESVNLIDEYNDKQTAELDSLDRASMGNNNTSSFCYREVDDSENLSQHAYGRAIDLNPKINPWIRGKEFSPANAEKYLDRSGDGLSDVEKAAMIRKDDEVYNIFTAHGWKWGGDWKNEKDYQHFWKSE